jgi:hypothetical protein
MDSEAPIRHPDRIFLLSPASTAGRRAALLLRPEAAFDLALRLRAAGGAPLGEVFSFLSGLYFRGKLAYARAFARPPAGAGAIHVITSCRGLLPPERHVTHADLLDFAAVPIDGADPRYLGPLIASAGQVAAAIAPDTEVVLLGSVATGKYVDVLAEIFGPRLRFPAEFVGRGDMSRGGLMLRCAADGTELTYLPLAGARRRGARPPKLPPRR